MAKELLLDPVTRLEGHFAVQVKLEEGRVKEAFAKGEMFRGYERILLGRHPMDAQQITQRICGVCPISHGMASIAAQDQAYGIQPPSNGRLLRNLILAANYIQSHILHFYHLSALDYVDIAAILHYEGTEEALLDLQSWVKTQLDSKLVYAAAPFLPRYEGNYLTDVPTNLMAVRHYLKALDMRRVAHQMVAIFSGKVPHAPTLIAGGVTERVTARKIGQYRSKLSQLHAFIKEAYLPDVLAVAGAFPDYFTMGKGVGNYLAYGVFPDDDRQKETYFPAGVIVQGQLQPFVAEKITEDLHYALFDSVDSGLHPAKGRTNPQPGKNGAYSWLKAPRYEGKVMEVGPLARVLVSYMTGKDAVLKKMVDHVLVTLKRPTADLNSAMGRHAARAIECLLVAEKCVQWLDQLKPGEPSFLDFKLPDQGVGMGLVEAPRGALGHWIEVEAGKIKNYQCVVPTTWNCSPRDDKGQPGALEQALMGTVVADEKNPLEVARVIRSFDPCLACAVH